ncbi:MAG: hypothetical protein H6774_01855 [Pseudomonadales bacterium]|nr:hypothetical protein [Candidatus Woesebacteria bacterium]MCB9801810.1 hypothetical protein [Pseudomonadales bacterium]
MKKKSNATISNKHTLFSFCLIVLVYSSLGGIALLTDNASLATLAPLSIGIALGLGILIVDQLFLSQYYLESGETQLITRSVIFLLILIPLSIFVLTSSGSLVGMGMMIGLQVGLTAEMLQLRKQPDAFARRFLQHVHHQYSNQEIKLIIFAAVVVVILTHLFVFL